MKKDYFLARLLDDELAKIAMPEAFLTDQNHLASVKGILLVFNNAASIDLDDQYMARWKNIMISTGLFTEERVNEICVVEEVEI